jgi:hypothetical protein
MASNARKALITANPRWVRRRFLRKHSGLHRAVVFAIPASTALWALIIHVAHTFLSVN